MAIKTHKMATTPNVDPTTVGTISTVTTVEHKHKLLFMTLVYTQHMSTECVGDVVWEVINTESR